MSSGIYSQTISNFTLVTPMCSSNNGSVQLSFTGVSSYPFTIYWYGSGINYGTTSITSSTQTITLSPGTFGTEGFRVVFMGPNQNYLGTYDAGIAFDKVNSFIAPTCSTPASFSVNNIRGGTGPYTIALEDALNSNVIVSGTSPLSVPFSNVCPVNNGVALRVTDANGCSFLASDSLLYIECVGLGVTVGTTNASCQNGTAQVTLVSGGTAPYSYQWHNGATTSSLSNLRRGPVNCIVTDATNCAGIGYNYVDQNPTINVNTTTKAANCNFADGQGTAFGTGGTAPYSYLWDNGSTTQSVTNLTTGVHKVEVTDANGCTGENYTYVNTVSPVQVTYTSTTSACTSATGTATLSVSGGTAPYTYVWHGQSSTTNTISGLPVGQQSFTVTDANGCVRDGIVIINPISVISASINEFNPICPSTIGSASVNASSTAMPITYLWSNSATTSTITNVNVGVYSVKITDANGCSVTKNAFITAETPVKISLSSSNASCIFNSDGTASVTAFGGTAPYTYRWSNGQTTASMTGIPTGRYYVWVTDANGCKSNTIRNYIEIDYDKNNNSCYCEITGVIYDDKDSNCVKGSGEDALENVLVKCTGFGYALTNKFGVYSFKVPVGNYTISEILDKGYSLYSCQTNNQTVNVTSVGSNCKHTVDFGNKVTPRHDMLIFSLMTSPAIPGNNYRHKMIVINKGNTTETDVQVGYEDDGQLSWNGAYPSMVSAGTDYYKFNAPITLKRFEKATYNIEYFTPTTLPINTSLYFIDSVAYTDPVSNYWINNEETPWDNINEFYNIVASSYDPNYKSVFPQGVGKEGKIKLSEKNFNYVVHFENNGTAKAQKIVVIDTLDSDFDIESFRTIDASHGVETKVSPNGVVTFTFNNIYLDYTPVGVYKPSAQGYVAYTIKAKNSVQIGTELKNSADIYFDYNAPIKTNTTVNTYAVNPTSIESVSQSNVAISVYPNPNSGEMYVAIPESFGDNNSIEIYNLQGQLLQSGLTLNEAGKVNIDSV
ncbi:MAG TPA: T9SS type A sorting domain-containing protein, partial [Bacteroidia bacterium]